MKRGEDFEQTIRGRLNTTADTLRRAFAEFLTIPTVVIGAFLVLSLVTYLVDRSELGWLVPLKDFMKSRVFGDPQSTGNLLSSVASSLLTVTSITFSLLLLAVQQSAGSLSTQVFDQFLRRPLNQVYFGFFLGLALFALITLATVNNPFNPVFGATVVLVMTVAALYLLVLLIYNSIDQMRPTTIIEAIREHILKARERQLSLVRQTRRAPRLQHAIHKTVSAGVYGYIHSVDIAILRSALEKAQDEAEVVIAGPVGHFVAHGDRIAEVRVKKEADADRLCEAANRAIHIERKRDIDTDPIYGVEQLATIAWTSTSTAKSNPSPAIIAIHALRDVLARWSTPGEEPQDLSEKERIAVVYPDGAALEVLNQFESLTVAASESMQHQTLAEIVRTVSTLYPRLTQNEQQRAADLARRMISSLGDQVLTKQLEEALDELRLVLAMGEQAATAEALGRAIDKLRCSVGDLNSRSTRVPHASKSGNISDPRYEESVVNRKENLNGRNRTWKDRFPADR